MPRLSIVVVVYNMRREAPRTLFSLSPPYQEGVGADDYEIIVVDNGSDRPLKREAIAGIGANVRSFRIEEASPSPAAALNFGVAQSSAPDLGLMIDGARLATPGVLRQALLCLAGFKRPVVATAGFHLGPSAQSWSLEHGYDAATEDRLLAEIAWRQHGYRLFEIGVPAGSSENGVFHPLAESNLLFLPRALYDEVGGFDERFELPGGGLVNLDFYRRLCELPRSRQIVLLGEATFHQVHGGAATSLPAEEFGRFWDRGAEEYERLSGRPYVPPDRRPLLFGETRQEVLPWLQKSSGAMRRLSGGRPPVRFEEGWPAAGEPGPETVPGSAAPTPAASRVGVIVLGMHRSGTSAIGHLLGELGMSFGGTLLEPRADNPLGFWEHAEVYAVHEQFLAAIDRSWNDPGPLSAEPFRSLAADHARRQLGEIYRRDFAPQDLWVLKDPRLCRLLPLWDEVLRGADAEIHFVHLHRHPDTVAASLARRNGTGRGLAVLLWLRHVLEGERHTRGRRRHWVGFEELVADPTSTMASLCGHLGLSDRLRPREQAAVCERVVVPSEVHHAASEPGGTRLHPWIQRSYQALPGAGRDATPEQLAELEAVAAELATAERLLDPRKLSGQLFAELQDQARESRLSFTEAQRYALSLKQALETKDRNFEELERYAVHLRDEVIPAKDREIEALRRRS